MDEFGITYFISKIWIFGAFVPEAIVITTSDNVQEHFIGKRLIMEDRDILVKCIIREIVFVAYFIASLVVFLKG